MDKLNLTTDDFLVYTEFLRGFHSPEPRLVKDFNMLKAFKASNSICICGNGDSLINSLERHQPLKDSDLVGTSALIAYRRSPTFIFHEPMGSNTGFDMKIGSKYLVMIDNIIQSHLTALLQERSDIAVLENPQLADPEATDYHPYLNPNLSAENAYWPPYYFVEEHDNSSILISLKEYAEVGVPAILNFRCSLIRALSLSYILEYKTINFAGLDPSSPNYWYTEHYQNQILYQGVNLQLKHLFKLYGQLVNTSSSNRKMHEGELYESDFSMNKSIWFVISVLDKWARNLGRTIPTINYYGSDPNTIGYINTVTKANRVNVFND